MLIFKEFIYCSQLSKYCSILCKAKTLNAIATESGTLTQLLNNVKKTYTARQTGTKNLPFNTNSKKQSYVVIVIDSCSYIIIYRKTVKNTS